MKIYTSNQLSPEEKTDVFAIWNSAYPAQIAYTRMEDFENYLSSCPNPVHWLVKESSHVVGWLCTFDRNGERWFALIVHPDHQKKNIGKRLLLHMQGIEKSVRGWMIAHDEYVRVDGELYLSPKGFYQRFGFKITDEKMETQVLSTVKIVWDKK